MPGVSLGCQHFGIGTQQILFLAGHFPGRADQRVVAVAVLELTPREPGVQLGLEGQEQFVYRQHSVIALAAGVDCGNLFVPDEQQGLLAEQGHAGVENVRQLVPFELGQGGAVDFGPPQEALVGCVPDGVVAVVHLHGEAQVLCCVLHRLPADAGSEGGALGVERSVLVQRFDMQALDLAALPLAFLGLVLVIPQHSREVRERGEEFVLAG